MKQSVFIVLLVLFSISSYGQKDKMCPLYQKEFSAALKSKKTDEIKDSYQRLLNVCGLDYVEEKQLERIIKIYKSKGIENVGLDNFGSIAFASKKSTWESPYTRIGYQDLDAKSELKKKYPTREILDDKLHAQGIDSATYFIPELKLIEVKVGQYMGLYDYDLKEVLPISHSHIIHYAYPYIAVSVEMNKNYLFNLATRKADAVFYNYINFFIRTGKESGFFIADKDKKSYFIDHNGKIIKEVDGSAFQENALGAISVSKDQVKELISYDFKQLIPPSKVLTYFFEEGKVFVGVGDMDDKEHVLDENYQPVFSYPEYERVGFNYGNVILVKDGKYGVKNVVTKKEILPFKYQQLYYLTNNIFVSIEDGKNLIIDDKGRVLRELPDLNINILNSSGQLLFVIQEGEKYGVADFYGEIILPVEHSNVRRSPFGPQIIIYDRETGKDTFYDYNGKVKLVN